jgi:hypothetical protein
MVLVVSSNWKTYFWSGGFIIIAVNFLLLSVSFASGFGLRARMKRDSISPATLTGLTYGLGTFTFNVVLALASSTWVKALPSEKYIGQTLIVVACVLLIFSSNYMLFDWLKKKVKSIQ